MGAHLIYGANGFTGELTAREAHRKGQKPILAGRREGPVRALAEELGLEWRIASLGTPREVDTLLDGVEVVLHCAGPFSATSKPMVDACLRTQTHYLDITGEMGVFREVFSRNDEAKAAGVVLIPGAGFDVVPTDCMAAMLHEKLPSATHLELAFAGLGSISRGTLKTSVEGMAHGGWVRRNHKLSPIRTGSLTRTIPFSRKPLHGMAIPWGDVYTAYKTTQIPNITVYTAVPPSTAAWARRTSGLQKWAAIPWIQRMLKSWIDRRPPGPDAELRQTGYSDIWGRVEDSDGKWVEGEFTTPE